MSEVVAAGEAELTLPQQARLVRALAAAQSLHHKVEHPDIIETHISYVVLAGGFAYKIKKAVDLGFLDFTRLASRRFYCGEELRLNRRSAPQLYLAVVALTGEIDAPKVDGTGPVLDWAVKMRQFPQGALAASLLAEGRLATEQFDMLAQDIAALHARADVCAPHSPFGTPEHVLTPALENFAALSQAPLARGDRLALGELREWTRAEFVKLRPLFATRKREGYVRECHGDLHLRNLVQLDGRLTPFDCIEFDPDLRWIDVMSDVAFVCMDLDHSGRADLAARVIDRYAECSGDYGGLPAWRFYRVYRALVRAKVAALQRAQAASGHRPAADRRDELHAHIALARHYARPGVPALILTHGVSGSGKTSLTQALVEAMGAIRLRSDVERRRLFGRPLRAGAREAAGRYSERASDDTYARLRALSARLLAAGFCVVVDATFLQRARREAFYALAREHDAALLVLDFEAPVEVLRARVAQRERAGKDASEATVAVLEGQLASREPLTQIERLHTLSIDSTLAAQPGYLERRWQWVAQRLRGDLARAGGHRVS